jgi:hypothetical protein
LTGDGCEQHCVASQPIPGLEVPPLQEQKSPLLAGFCNSALVSKLPKWRTRRPFRQKSPANTANIPVLGRQRPESWFDRDCRPRAAVYFTCYATARACSKDEAPALRRQIVCGGRACLAGPSPALGTEGDGNARVWACRATPVSPLAPSNGREIRAAPSIPCRAG